MRRGIANYLTVVFLAVTVVFFASTDARCFITIPKLPEITVRSSTELIDGLMRMLASAPLFSDDELEAFETIKKAKEFEKSLGLSPTDNFIEFREEEKGSWQCHGYVKKEEDVPFSIYDPAVSQYQCDDLAKFLGVDIESLDYKNGVYLGRESGYEFSIFKCRPPVYNAMITRSLLARERARLIYVVVHEDVHSNLNLPLHFEESAGNLIGSVSARLLLGESEQNIYAYDRVYEISFSKFVIDVHSVLTFWSRQYKKGAIDRQEFLDRKEEIIDYLTRNWYQTNSLMISDYHTYYYYFPTVVRVFERLGSDLPAFVRFLKTIPITGPEWRGDRVEWFNETRAREKDVEKYINNIFGEARYAW